VSLPPYHKYKDSGVEWLGEVPAHWKVCALNYRFEVALGKMLDEKRITGEHLAPYLRNVDVQWGRINTQDLPEMDFSGPDLTRYSVRPGDLLVCEGGEVGRSAVWQGQLEECFYQKALHRLRPRSGNESAYFFYYVLHAAANLGIFSGSEGKATIAHLTAETFRRHRFPFPPADEQVAIAVSLDRETGKIDALVEEQQQLIELVKEKRQAVISHAVTKGLNPDALMKDSGIKWIGDLPAHWDLKPLRRFPCSVQTGPFGSQLHADEYITGGTPVINPVNLIDGTIIPGEETTVGSDVVDRLRHQQLQIGDVIFSRRGELGRCALVSDAEAGWLCGTGAMILRLDRTNLTNEYLSTYLSLGLLRQYFESFSIGATMESLSSSTLLAMPLILPPRQEQLNIVSFVNSESTKLDRLISEANHAIDLLRERRTTLISAAVTGKIDVRGLIEASVA
jgi:type I restriction enzyme, S subunit